MSSHRHKHPPSAEWVGGIATLPSYVIDKGEPFRPEVLVWMGVDGMVHGSEVGRPGELLQQAGDSLRRTVARPMSGPVPQPRRVRVALPSLAAVLRASAPAIEVVCAPTPELDELVAHMHESFGRDDAGPQTYLSPGVTPAAMGSFFEAAAALHRRAPWSVVPDDQTLIGVDIPAFEVRGAVLSIIGGIGESFGFLLFDSPADFHEFVEAAALIVHGDIPELPPHFAVNFERGADLAPELRKEVATHGWEVAGAEAYPWPVVIDGDLVARTPSARELAVAEAICRALVRMLDEHRPALEAAWDGGAAFADAFKLATAAGVVDVALTTPVALPSDDGPFHVPERRDRGASAANRKRKRKARRGTR